MTDDEASLEPIPQDASGEPIPQDAQTLAPYSIGEPRYTRPPNTSKTPSRTRAGTTAYVTVGAVIAVVVAAAIAVVLLRARDQDGTQPAAGGASASATRSPAVGTKATASVSPPGPARTADATRASARRLDALLAVSATRRGTVQPAVNRVFACRLPASAAVVLREASAARRDLTVRLKDIDVSALPHGPALVDHLSAAWNASAEADDAYASWADEHDGCTGRATQTSSYVAAQAASEEATAQKVAFTRLWSPIAGRHGLAQRDQSKL